MVVGMIPFPIVLGVFFDKSCLVWEERCGETGSCWVYDGVALSRGITAAVFVAGAITALLYALALKLYKAPQEMEKPMLDQDELVMSDEGAGGRRRQEERVSSRF